MGIKNKRGSIMAEAAFIFPLVIAAVMAVLYIVISLFLSLRLQADLHLDLRNEAGRIAETVYREEQASSIGIERGYMNFRPILEGERARDYKKNALILGNMKKAEHGRVYIIDEAALIRQVSLAKEILP